jgi:hypothetical protein
MSTISDYHPCRQPAVRIFGQASVPNHNFVLAPGYVVFDPSISGRPFAQSVRSDEKRIVGSPRSYGTLGTDT